MGSRNVRGLFFRGGKKLRENSTNMIAYHLREWEVLNWGERERQTGEDIINDSLTC